MRFRWSQEPVAYVTLAIIVLGIVKDVLTHNIDYGTAVNSILIAVGGVVARSSVVPVKGRWK